MSEEIIILTDPARELAELCAVLHVNSGASGETFLAEHFGVLAWSREFFQIVFTIVERCNLLQQIVANLDMDADIQNDIIEHINKIISAFSANSMKQGWGSCGYNQIGPVNVNSVKAISGLVRQKVSYRKLSDAEVLDLDAQVGLLLEWLNDHQLSERDFIRQALIDGLEHFRFRLKRLQWLGWGYTLDSLRDVISAYMLLERSGADPKTNPDAAAVLQKVAATMKLVYEKLTSAKDISEKGEWLLKLYGAGSIIYQGGKPLVAGLIGLS